MTNSALAVTPVLGAQRPRVCSIPDSSSSSGEEAVELARMAGLFLDPWQEFVLSSALGNRADGKWSAFEVGLVVSRQNGKGSILEARELAGLFVLRERFIIHSAHQFDTSLEAFRRLLTLIEETPDLEQEVKRVSKSHGEEGIELKTGQRIRFRTRTKGGGRGFTADCLILDEAMILSEESHAALMPTLSARPNPQVWYTGSAVDQMVHEHGVVLSRVRERGLAGNDPGLAYFEWSPDADIGQAPDLVEDERVWAEANPGLGIRITTEHVAREQRSMDPRTFAVERLGIGDWPSVDGSGGVIAPEVWDSLADFTSEAVGPVCFAFDVSPDRSSAAICAAGRRPDGLHHIEVIKHERGTGWVPGMVAKLVQKHPSISVVCDARGPAGSLIGEIELHGVVVKPLNASEHTQGCGLIFDAVQERTLRHLGTPELAAAVRGAVKRPLVDAWAWSRKSSNVDISPLVGCTLALWGSVDGGSLLGGGFEW